MDARRKGSICARHGRGRRSRAFYRGLRINDAVVDWVPNRRSGRLRLTEKGMRKLKALKREALPKRAEAFSLNKEDT